MTAVAEVRYVCHLLGRSGGAAPRPAAVRGMGLRFMYFEPDGVAPPVVHCPTAARGGARRGTVLPDAMLAIETRGLTRLFDGKPAVRGPRPRRPGGRLLRVPRPERRRQEHHHQDADRAARAHRGPRPRARRRPGARSARVKRAHGRRARRPRALRAALRRGAAPHPRAALRPRPRARRRGAPTSCSARSSSPTRQTSSSPSTATA